MANEEDGVCRHCKGVDTCSAKIWYIPPDKAVIEEICEVCGGNTYFLPDGDGVKSASEEQTAEFDKQFYKQK